jgi:hypothetical protein
MVGLFLSFIRSPEDNNNACDVKTTGTLATHVVGRRVSAFHWIARSSQPFLLMSSINELTLLDALLLMCENYQQLLAQDPLDPSLTDALKCIHDCEQRQMRLTHGTKRSISQ